MFGKGKDKGTKSPEPPKAPKEPKKKSGFLGKSIKGLFLVAAIGSAATYGAHKAGYSGPWNTTKSIFDSAAQIPGPLANALGLAIEVGPNERTIVTYGGNLDGLGYVATPGYNYMLPWGYKVEKTYRVDQYSLRVNTEMDGTTPVVIATNDNQLIQNTEFTLQIDLVDDKVGEIHRNAPEYERILKELVLRVGKEVLGDINISNVNDETQATKKAQAPDQQGTDILKAIPQQNLTAQRDQINRDLTKLLRDAIKGSALEGRIKIVGLQFTNFNFTDEFKADIEKFAKQKNEIISQRAILVQKDIKAEQLRTESAGQRDQQKNLADGQKYEIAETGKARGQALAAEVAPLAEKGADKLVEIKRIEAWQSGGAQVPKILTITNGNGGNGNAPAMVLDGRNLLPLLDGQKQPETKPDGDTSKLGVTSPVVTPALPQPGLK